MTHWHVTKSEARFYVDGVPVVIIPARYYATLIADLAAALQARLNAERNDPKSST
jgi:hypothetical protein